MQAEWFVLSNNQPVGPYTKDDLLALMQQGSLIPTSYVRRLDGPWITAAHAFSQIVASTALSPALTPIPTVPTAPIVSSSTGYYRRRTSSSSNLLITLCMIAIGGAAAVYTYKHFLFQHQPAREPEILVITPRAMPPTTRAPFPTKPFDKAKERPPALPPRPNGVPLPAATGTADKPPGGDVPQAKADPEAEAWLSTMKELAAHRDNLIAKRSELQQRLAPLLANAADTEAQCKNLEREAKRIRLQYSILDRDRQSILQQKILLNDSSLDSRLSTIASRMSNLEAEIKRYDSSSLRAQLGDLVKNLVPLKEQNEELIAEADRLRARIVWHLNPFSKVSDSVAAVAFAYFNRPIASDATIDKAWNHFGRACISMRKDDEESAERDFKQAFTLSPQEATFRAVHGVWQDRLGRDKEGLEDLITSLKSDPDNWTVNYLYGLVLCKRGTFSGAETRLRECRRLDPKNARGLGFLALLKSATEDAKMRNADFAMLLAKEAFELEDTAGSRVALASALAESGKFDEAVLHAQKAVAKASPSQAAWCHDNLHLLEAKKPLRIDWKTFDSWAAL